MLGHTYFPEEWGQKIPHGSSKKSTDSSAVAFLVREGPLLWVSLRRDRNNQHTFFSANSLKNRSGCSRKVYAVPKNVCLEFFMFQSRKGPGTNFLGPEKKGSFAGVSRQVSSPQSYVFAFATRVTIYRSLRALRARSRKKKFKKSALGGLQQRPRKYPKNVETYPKLDLWGYFSTSSGIFRDFCRPPRRLFFQNSLGGSIPKNQI